jgi:hypothetical protein
MTWWTLALIAASLTLLVVGFVAAREIDRVLWDWRARRRAGRRKGWLL